MLSVIKPAAVALVTWLAAVSNAYTREQCPQQELLKPRGTGPVSSEKSGIIHQF